MRLRLGCALLFVAACAPRVSPPPPADPLEPTHDVDARLLAVLETDALEGSCDAVRAGDTSRVTRLRCGKQMFFRETFGTTGIPKRLLRFAQKYYRGFYGAGFARFGLVPDPNDDEGMPLGLAPSRDGSLAFTCAACHFGQLPDGRYAVGFGNTRFQYGRFIASLGAPLLLSFDANNPEVASAMRTQLAPHLNAARDRAGYPLEAAALGTLLLLQGSASPFSVAVQEQHLALPPGVMDFLTPPLLDDGVWTPSRILSLWNLPTQAQRTRAGMPHEMLSWNGGVPSLEVFVGGFTALGLGKNATAEQLAPLAEYIRTLSAPRSGTPPNEEGERLFRERGCQGCHAGPSGEGTRVFGFAELETDAAYANIYAPRPDGSLCCGFEGGAGIATRGIKAPRLEGVFAATRLLHDGSVSSLESLFCLEPRAVGGHRQSCVGLTDDEKRALISFLRAW